MQPEQKQQIERMLEMMRATMIAKGHDYAGADTLANFKEVNRIGISTPKSIFVRLSDKYMRLSRFLSTDDLKVKDEQIEDTLLDLANYAVLMSVALKENKTEDKIQAKP
jgi:hypothetical protein